MSNLARDIHARVLRQFTWTPDSEQFGRLEDWRDYADAVQAGETFRDDCDGFALTCARLALDAGADPSDVLLVVCSTEIGERHLIAVIEGYAADHRQRTAWAWDALPYTWHQAARMSAPEAWLKVPE